MSSPRTRTVQAIVVVAASLRTNTASAEPLRLRADAVAEARAPAGLLVLQGANSERRSIHFEALVWTGYARSPAAELPSDRARRSSSDILVLTLRVREPRGFAEILGGRFVLMTGAIRPVQVDGLTVTARSPWGTKLELFAGVPVVREALPTRAESAVGGRVAQVIADRATLGFSYYRRQSGGESMTEEVGADLAATPTRWLDFAGKAAYSMVSLGFVEASMSAATRSSDYRFEVFASHRSPSRLLPATSLFSVLGDYPAQVVGTAIRWYAAPRLDVWANVAGKLVSGEAGGEGALRGTLRTDDRGDGSVGLEVRRQHVGSARWTGARLVATEPLARGLRVSIEVEVAAPDQPRERGLLWPWGLLALGWRSSSAWEAALAIEAGSTPRYSFETNALVRVSRALDLP